MNALVLVNEMIDGFPCWEGAVKMDFNRKLSEKEDKEKTKDDFKKELTRC